MIMMIYIYIYIYGGLGLSAERGCLHFTCANTVWKVMNSVILSSTMTKL